MRTEGATGGEQRRSAHALGVAQEQRAGGRCSGAECSTGPRGLFVLSRQTGLLLQRPQPSGSPAGQRSIGREGRVAWDSAQYRFLNFLEVQSMLVGVEPIWREGRARAKYTYKTFLKVCKWVLPLNLQASSTCTYSLQKQAHTVSGYCSRCYTLAAATLFQ